MSGVSLWAAGVVFGLVPAHYAAAAPVVIQPGVNILTANCVADLGSGDSAQHKDEQDVADLAKSGVNAHAEVTVDTTSTSGSVTADLMSHDAGFEMKGNASTTLPDGNPFPANTTAVNNTLVPFTVSEGFLAHIAYVINIDSMVTNDQKVTIELRRQGDDVSLFHQIYNKSTTSSLDAIGAGSYRLLAVTGSISTAKGVAGETGSADYHVTVSTSATDDGTPPPAAIPLPAAALPGGIALALVLGAMQLRRRAV